MAAQGGLLRHLDCAPVALGEALDVGRVAEVRQLDERRIARIARTQAEESAGPRPKEHDLDAELRVLLDRVGEPEHQIGRLRARTPRTVESGDRVQSRRSPTGTYIAEVDVYG